MRIPFVVGLALLLAAGAIAAPEEPGVRWTRITWPQVVAPGHESDPPLSFVVQPDDGEGERGLVFQATCAVAGREEAPPWFSRGLHVRLHRADGEVVEPREEVTVGTGNGLGTQVHLLADFPWGGNALAEGFFEVRIGDEGALWLEVPYGFLRDPAAPPAAARVGAGPPVFVPAMADLGAKDRVVAFRAVTYDLGGSPPLSVAVSNPFDARLTLSLHGTRDLFAPRTSVGVERPAAGALVGRLVRLDATEGRGGREDTFVFDRAPSQDRTWGRLVVAVGEREEAITIPSSLFTYVHGVSEPHHPQLVRPTFR